MGNDRKYVCCNCGNNIRTQIDEAHVRCNCQIDGHYIGYLDNFEHWCNRWRKDKSWEVKNNA